MARRILLKDQTSAQVGTPADGYTYLYSDSATGTLYEKDNTTKDDPVGRVGTKVYRAVISQSGSGDGGEPTVDTLLENTTGITFTWGYFGVGSYTLNGSGAFPNSSKIAVVFGANGGDATAALRWTYVSQDQIRINSWNITQNRDNDSTISKMYIEIRIFE